ncbi:lysylphosphatidylglycerol synthase domain-containing protein [Winogradskyella sp. A3E31]|uniref:lysylphosphatidylglycerol synthase domain-containing protein n=1 Tax=Winogradskyella sp. A3E31 TaxID=3349637 RepID=UPI00398B3524
MHYALPYKTKQFFIAVIKFSIVIGCLYFIYKKLVYNEDLAFSDFYQILTKNDVFSPKNIIFLLILTILNWFFEILKWQVLVKTITSISFFKAFQQSLAGASASLITPNKIGDYGAKIIYFKKPLQKKAALLNLIGHITQMGVTTVFGIIGLSVFVVTFKVSFDLSVVLKALIILTIVGTLIAFGTRQKHFEIRGFSLNKIWNYIKTIPKSNLLLNAIFAIIRYGIFSFQFGFILYLLGVEIEVFHFVIAITSMYFLASIIPALSLFDVVIKSSVAIYILSFLGVDTILILATTTLMWALNFVLPSLLGSYFILNFKLPKASTQ